MNLIYYLFRKWKSSLLIDEKARLRDLLSNTCFRDIGALLMDNTNINTIITNIACNY